MTKGSLDRAALHAIMRGRWRLQHEQHSHVEQRVEQDAGAHQLVQRAVTSNGTSRSASTGSRALRRRDSNAQSRYFHTEFSTCSTMHIARHSDDYDNTQPPTFQAADAYPRVILGYVVSYPLDVFERVLFVHVEPRLRPQFPFGSRLACWPRAP